LQFIKSNLQKKPVETNNDHKMKEKTANAVEAVCLLFLLLD